MESTPRNAHRRPSRRFLAADASRQPTGQPARPGSTASHNGSVETRVYQRRTQGTQNSSPRFVVGRHLVERRVSPRPDYYYSSPRHVDEPLASGLPPRFTSSFQRCGVWCAFCSFRSISTLFPRSTWFRGAIRVEGGARK